MCDTRLAVAAPSSVFSLVFDHNIRRADTAVPHEGGKRTVFDVDYPRIETMHFVMAWFIMLYYPLCAESAARTNGEEVKWSRVMLEMANLWLFGFLAHFLGLCLLIFYSPMPFMAGPVVAESCSALKFIVLGAFPFPWLVDMSDLRLVRVTVAQNGIILSREQKTNIFGLLGTCVAPDLLLVRCNEE